MALFLTALIVFLIIINLDTVFEWLILACGMAVFYYVLFSLITWHLLFT